MNTLPQRPALVGYDPVANSGYLGCHKLYLALLPTLNADQAKVAAAVLEEMQARQRLAHANALAAIGDFEVTGEAVLLTLPAASTANPA